MNNTSSLLSIINTYGFLVILGLVLGLYAQRKKFLKGIGLIGMSTFLSVVVGVLFKELFLIPRPFLQSGVEPRLGLTYFSSFPSLHTLIVFSAVMVLWNLNKKMGVVVGVLALILSLGRVWGGVHFGVDVWAGMVIGVLIGRLVVDFWHSLS